MIHYTFLTDPTPAQIHQLTTLYRGAGWWPDDAEDPATIAGIVSGSHCFVSAARAADGRIVGMGRAISDRTSDAYIQDVTVDTRYRGDGIGSKIIRMLIARLRGDGLSWIGLIAEKNSHPFYENLGFCIMPEATPLLLSPS